MDEYIDINPLADRNQFYCTGVYKLADYPCDTVTVIGIKGRSNQEQVLWEGTEGSAGTYETQSSISLGDSLENYKKFGVAFSRYDADGRQFPGYCEFLTSQSQEAAEKSADFLLLCDTCKILNESTMQELKLTVVYSIIKKS